MRNKCEFLLISYVTVVIISGSAGSKCGNKGTGFQNPADGVCSNVDIRNDMEQFRKLENCTVVEGFLHISLIERAEHKDYEKWSFPELREITDHLMLYRVYGLKTLRHLFPNLAVIRGRELFNNYALVAYEMRDLEELGLVNLHTISRGGVRLTKSKKLCYIDTVDWARIGVDPVAQDFKDNKEESQCANYCPEQCPSTKVGNVEAKRCWTAKHCQKGLNCKNCQVNQTCMDDGRCCHDYCLGGCTGPGPGDCFSCKGVVYQDKCQPQCPPHTYMFFERRCLTDKECLGLRNRTEYKGGSTKILRGEKGEPSMCVFTCPQNYTMREDGELKNSECVKCQGFCPKVCNGTDVSSIEDAQRLEHCSKIVGPLVIQIMGGSNVAQEMEKNLGSIKEVTGFLNVRRSYALLTLYFFKSLEIIGGENLQHQGHSLVVMDNSNLQELFPEEQMKKMKIKRGKVSFHSNRKLCYYKIKNFVKYLNLTEDPSEQDISRSTNGDLKPCNEHHLRLNVTQIYHNSVILQWEKDSQDARQLLTYIVNHKEIKDKNDNVNIYQGRDACSDDVWSTQEVQPSDSNYQMGVVGNLKAYTTYAVYVQSYTLSTAAHSAMTNVEVFTTNPYYPTEPIDLEVSSDDPEELRVRWNPPKSPNGNVTHYKVMYQKQRLNIKSFEQRDYCDDPISTPKVVTKDKEEEEEKKLNLTADCCACPKSKEELDAEVRKQEIEVYFENYLHSHVYCQRYDTLPEDILIQRYSLRGLSEITDLDDLLGSKSTNTSNIIQIDEVSYSTTNTGDTSNENSTAASTGTSGNGTNLTDMVQEVVIYGTEVVLPNLVHFTEYSIEVQACQETNTDEKVDSKLCSNRAITAGRTKANWTMDRINESTISVELVKNSTGDVLIKWEPPPNPNGLILTYNLFYKRANQDNLVPSKVCINRRQFQKDSGYRLTGLEPGNWTFQINAISLAGNSSSTPEKFFIVPQPPDDEDSSKVFIAITAISVLVVIVIVIIIVWVIAKNRFHRPVLSVISPNINYVPSEHMYIMDGWEVDRDKIKLIKELGQGSFGMVYEGVAKGIHDDPDEEIRVAVKTVNDRASFNDRREFLKEATTMKAFDCFHVVKLLGVVSTGQPALVIMELMALGDLKNYLREHRPDEQERPGVSPPKLQDILQMAGEIADGMAYLADKKFVHRDLAARNCMVAEDRTVKIGDFGMTRDIYETDYYRKGGKGMLPVRWMAPESLKDGVFTSMSDVWSYGVVMWEMITLAAQPYQGLSNEEVVKYISDGSTMDMPDRCPMKMAYLMQRCWAKKPKSRPTFKEIIEYLLPELNPRFEKVSYFFNDGGGPVGGGTGAMGEPAEGSDDASSINSLSCEGAAAPRLSLTGKDDYQFQSGSPNQMGSAGSLYDDGLDAETYLESPYLPSGRDNFGDLDHFHPSPNEFTLDFDDSSRPFISEDLQAVPHVKTRQPSSLLSHEQNGNDSALRNSGLIELQPLISKDRGLSPPSPRLKNVQPSSSPGASPSGFFDSNPISSEYMVHQPPTLTTNDHNSPSDPQSLQQPNHAAADSCTSGQVSDNNNPDGAAAVNPSWQSSSRPNAAKTAQSSVLARPTLRLPTLNQPPSGGFRRVPLYTSSSSGDKNNYSSRTSQPSSSDHPYHLRTAPSPVSSNVVSMEEGRPSLSLSPSEETSPTSSSARHYSPPPGAITSSSDGSKESSKSSGSHSLINGLTNGHIANAKSRHRTAPC